MMNIHLQQFTFFTILHYCNFTFYSIAFYLPDPEPIFTLLSQYSPHKKDFSLRKQGKKLSRSTAERKEVTRGPPELVQHFRL
jgi:hypothetical protein